MIETGYPKAQGLYDPRNERDACGFGFVADIQGRRSHDIVEKALTVLVNLEHRGAVGAEKNTGDGAGILFQTPHEFLARECREAGDRPARAGRPRPPAWSSCRPTPRGARPASGSSRRRSGRRGSSSSAGATSPPTTTRSAPPPASSQPVIRQVFVARGAGVADDAAFERKLYVVRRLVEKKISRSAIPGRTHFYVPSLSHKTIVYKGMLNAPQLREFYRDLADPATASGIAMVHSRFSTNTFPSWSRAHPYRYISHNGEINTLRGNVNWMHARQSMMESKLFGEDLKKVLTVVDTDGSDSGMFDNVLELLHLAGRELPHAMMMMVPEPWTRHESMSGEKKAFYEFHSCLMEPWDGPASIAFTDGVSRRRAARSERPAPLPLLRHEGRAGGHGVGGRRPRPPGRPTSCRRGGSSRGACSSSTPPSSGSSRTTTSRAGSPRAAPYAEWLQRFLVDLAELPAPAGVIGPDHETVLRRQEVFGYTSEEVTMLLSPMATGGAEPIGSMGTDTPLAVLSEKPQPLFNYFKQLFAQVTNPPVDAIREELIMSVETAVGPEGNLLEPGPESARQLGAPVRGAAERGAGEDPRPRRRRGVEGAALHHAPHPLQADRRRLAPEGDRGPARPRLAGRSRRGSTSSSSPTAATTPSTRRSPRSSPSRRSTTT